MKPKVKKKPFYLNPIAQIFLMCYTPIKVFIGGRGVGKSFDNGLEVAKKVRDLPRSKGLFVGVTYTQILTNTLLPMKSAWETMGYYEGIHYVVGKKPPEHFVKPFQRPEKYENVITFWNGTTLVFGSMDRPQLMRGSSYDWVITDESLLIKKDQYDQIIQFAIRATHPSLKGMPGHLQEIFTSSMPYGSLGSWLLEYELKMKQAPEHYFYIEATSWHNRKILGDETIMKWWRETSRIQYMVEVMNKRIRSFGAVFYPSLADRHWYSDSYEYDFIDNLGLSTKSEYKKDSRWDKDCDTNQALHVSHDWGAFNCIVIGQENRDINQVRVINGMHVHGPFQELAKNFCEYYKHHKKKVIYQWGDKSGNKKEANSKMTYFQDFASILKDNGWRVIKCKTGDIPYLERHRFFNKLHQEKVPHLPRIRYNANNCKDLNIALESAPMKDYKKDKSSENNPHIKQEHATHYTDAHDYWLYHYLIGREKSNVVSASEEVSFSS